MSELRWHPFLQTWVISATHRQDRPLLPPPEYCPLCPTQPGAYPTEVPEADYEIVVFQNKFPSLQPDPPEPAVESSGLYQVAPAQGECEVVLYTPDHYATLTRQPVGHLRNLIDVWADRYEELSRRPGIEYVLIFENRGAEVGVTLRHPHGQIYAFPFIPPIPAQELAASRAHFEKSGRCLGCHVVAEERSDGRRLLYEDEHFVAFVPFFARFPYEVHLYPKAHRTAITDLSDAERWSFARALKATLVRYDGLWGFPLPYMMVQHQRPTDGQLHRHFHFHVEFCPLHRAPDKLKYLAGSETGAGTFVVDIAAEDMARRLRAVPLDGPETGAAPAGNEPAGPERAAGHRRHEEGAR